MADLKLLSWNVEHFDGSGGKATRGRDRDAIIYVRKDRLKRIIDHLANENADVFGLSEVESATVYEAVRNAMPEYSFQITEGRQSQEILVGVKSSLRPFFTQKTEFQRNNPYLRPGVLATVHPENSDPVQILFTHLKSSTSPEGFGLRDAMLNKVYDLKNTLNKAARKMNGSGSSANFIVMGDMNTMGMDYHPDRHDITGKDEISAIQAATKRRRMNFLSKDFAATFSNGTGSKYPDSDLDHVIAQRHLSFENPVDADNPNPVHVGGWTELEKGEARDEWIKKFSDHAPISTILKL